MNGKVRIGSITVCREGMRLRANVPEPVGMSPGPSGDGRNIPETLNGVDFGDPF